MLRIVIEVTGEVDDAQGVKEALAMELERFGNVHVVEVCRIEPEQMRIGGTGQVISLEQWPDCEACDEISKRRTGYLMDAEGPGIVTPMYTCDKEHKCFAIKTIIARREGLL